MTKEKLYLLGEAAQVLGCKPYQITYALATHKVPEPKRVGGRRLFSVADLKALAKKLGITYNLNPRKEGK
jgi:DNA-binding transcriptional MerR regulator